MKNIAVIPARGGSKRIPKKNIRAFCGKPIIQYTIETALESKLFDDVIVSTDCQEIAASAMAAGANVPFMRPQNLADDYTGTTAVTRHAVREYESMVEQINSVCCIYATAPFLTVANLKKGFAALSGAEAAFSVTTFAYPIYRGLKSKAGRMTMLWPEKLTARSQDLPEVWHDAAQFYLARREFIFSGEDFLEGRAIGVEIPRYLVQDIDTEEDWIRAEAMYRALKDVGQL